MADLIDRQALLDALKTQKGSQILGHSTLRFLKLKDMIDAVSTADAVEVVRCKDCDHWKHFEHLGCTDFVKVCGLANYMIGANGYCLYAERREENG